MNCEICGNERNDFVCEDCKKSICKECAVDNNGKILCIDCAEEMGIPIIKRQSPNVNSKNQNVIYNNIESNKKPVSTFWTTILSFIPGAGHMYLGLMNRGLQFMLVFFGIIALVNVFSSANFLSPLYIIVWFYSVFDCYHIRKKIQSGENFKDSMIVEIDLKNINVKYTGIGFIIFGGLIIFNQILAEMRYILIKYGIDYYVLDVLKESIFPLILIAIGLVLLKKSKKGNISV